MSEGPQGTSVVQCSHPLCNADNDYLRAFAPLWPSVGGDRRVLGVASAYWQPTGECFAFKLEVPTPCTAAALRLHKQAFAQSYSCSATSFAQIMDWFDMRGIREAFTSVDYVGISAYVPQAGCYWFVGAVGQRNASMRC